jgi:CO/xanthine dehydrogenase Mo-binding subunit
MRPWRIKRCPSWSRGFYGEYLGVTDPMGAEKDNPVSHIAYSYATHVVDLDEDGRIGRVLAAHDVGRAVNPASIEGQVEGGVVMSLGWALSERFPLENGRPQLKYDRLASAGGSAPEIETIIVEKNDSELACGAKGIGEICSIPPPPPWRWRITRETAFSAPSSRLRSRPTAGNTLL